MRRILTSLSIRFVSLTLITIAIGCAANTTLPPSLDPPKRTTEPLGLQFMRIAPEFGAMPFRVVLDFEAETDLAFIGNAAGVGLSGVVAHTGMKSLAIPAECRSFTIKTAAMFSSRPFPGEWTFLGAYFIAQESTHVEITYRFGKEILAAKAVDIPARKWTPVVLDLSAISALAPGSNALQSPGSAAGVVHVSVSGPVYCEDVFVANNRKIIVNQAEKAGDYWSVRQEGYSLVIERPGSMLMARLPLSDATNFGWQVEEANDSRLILNDATARQRWVIYPDGRGFLNGQFKSINPLSAEETAAMKDQQESPGEIQVAEDLGRVERNSPGDANHDGYNEALGCYELKAVGPRMEFTITPKNRKIIRPIIEIAGLPRGKLLLNIEGKVVEKYSWLKNGNAVFEMPVIVDRPVTVEVKSQ